MEPIVVHTGTTIPIMNDDIDTDQIIPKQFLKNLLKTGYENALFYNWRYLPDGRPDPKFILNAPERQAATILITGSNFGSGSSREHAAWALKDWGIRVVIAGSFSDIFYMNCTKNGVLPIKLPQAARDQLARLNSDQAIVVDLPHQVVKNGEYTYPFEIDQTWKEKFISGDDDIDITMKHIQEIEAYEAQIPQYR
ncbi:3-isopropylmalate dehydratase small subunit [Limosilactobacillus gastricus]|uniref:3-isopropylmalate dehydratase small subunit n=1 Tax=Limosilactobacillus gastricus DSM 16045 TaxID=1423749 RepID=A0A0R1VEB2_9LACO|nr:3-isopropylmalate dehydratase small subunit [Limosilactobacillus gastricus]KRM02036.1 3-isopropylmalate dehydratase small subunit [Limosilactobacillus gastricus DSM 16045]QGF39965.1 3-isopropylmalate dehydratase small subunit [Limosilactobacillus gastricus]